jgi:8-oxo-dGTP pyrophosphatase MutT (NUDIX family)
MSNLVSELLKLAEKKKKPSGTATKSNPAKWEAAKRKAKAKMGGKHSARAMQLATKYYKEDGGGYKGKKPSASNNKLKKWTKQDWQWSGERKKESSVNEELVASLLELSKEASKKKKKKKKKKGKGVYLPAKAIAALKSSKKGRKKLRAASRKKTEATNKGEQVARHGLHEGKKRSKLSEEKRYRPKVQALLYDDLGRILASKSQAEGSGLRAYPNYKFPGGGVEPGESLVEAARKELLEEAGYSPASDPEDFGYQPTKVDWDEAFRQQALAKGRDFHGEEQFYMTAPVGERVESLLGSEGDQMTGLEFVPMSQLRSALEASSKDPSNEYGYFDVEKLKVLGQLGKHLKDKGVKTAAVDPNYRDRVALWLHDGKGNLLVQDDRDRGLGLKFPGGGIDEGQSVNDAAMREALEEVGYSLADKPRAIPGVRAKKIDWDPIFSAEAAAKGRNYKGSKHYHRLALAGDLDESLLGSEGDALAANWLPIAEVLEATRSAAANPDNKYNYFDEERLRAAERVMQLLGSKTASYQSPYWQAYLIGQKLATADFGDNGSSDDMTLSFDSDVKQVVDPKDFASPEPHGNMTPSTNSHGWVGTTDEVTPDKTEATNYKRDYLERT